jgi:hypothetical protein
MKGSTSRGMSSGRTGGMQRPKGLHLGRRRPLTHTKRSRGRHAGGRQALLPTTTTALPWSTPHASTHARTRLTCRVLHMRCRSKKRRCGSTRRLRMERARTSRSAPTMPGSSLAKRDRPRGRADTSRLGSVANDWGWRDGAQRAGSGAVGGGTHKGNVHGASGTEAGWPAPQLPAPAARLT